MRLELFNAEVSTKFTSFCIIYICVCVCVYRLMMIYYNLLINLGLGCFKALKILVQVCIIYCLGNLKDLEEC